MNPSHLNKAGLALPTHPPRRGRLSLLATVAGAFGSLAVLASKAAQAANGTIGAQIGTMAQEGSTAAGTVSSTAMYVAGLICFIGGAWAIWQGRQPQNREGGKMALGLAGLVLCGLFVTGGSWIGKAAQSTTGTAASISDQATVVKFQ